MTNAELTRTLRRVMRRPPLFPVPGFVLRLLLGDKALLVLKGQRPVPKRLLDIGFSFKFTEIEPALRDLLGKN